MHLSKAIRHLWKKRTGLSGERGISLAEVLVAVAIVGIALTALLSALSTGSLAVGRTDKQVTAENLARAQLEYTKGKAYSTSYEPLSPLPSGYSISIGVSSISGHDANIQKITVTIGYNGATVLVMEDFKTNR